MKKLFFVFLSGIFLYSCSTGNSEDDLRNQISGYKSEVIALNKKISNLENELSTLNPESEYRGVKIAVKTQEVKPQPFNHYFVATGTLESIEDAFISPETNGQVMEINVSEGQKVKKGDLLARLNTNLIEKSIEEVKTQLELAETIYNKQKKLWDQKIGSERQYLEAKNNYESLQNRLNTLDVQYNLSIIHSPINGFVENIFLKKGELAVPGMQIMQIVNIDKLYVTVDLSEAYLPVVKTGDTLDISFPSFPGLKMSKPVSRIGHVVNKANRTFVVQVKIDNAANKLKPNLLATIMINDYHSNESIVVPSILIKEDMKGAYLYVAIRNSDSWSAKKRYVTVGVSYKDEGEVLAGLNTGDIIITDGYNNVTDDVVIRIEN
ncbi:MAG: efflux RND transporter periplasmic adaptor subunit [Bacteroidales bacterium]|nr:efflux RND transporter periplasmic adaptor subunit [Bacteroidales bacterium]